MQPQPRPARQALQPRLKIQSLVIFLGLGHLLGARCHHRRLVRTTRAPARSALASGSCCCGAGAALPAPAWLDLRRARRARRSAAEQASRRALTKSPAPPPPAALSFLGLGLAVPPVRRHVTVLASRALAAGAALLGSGSDSGDAATAPGESAAPVRACLSPCGPTRAAAGTRRGQAAARGRTRGRRELLGELRELHPPAGSGRPACAGRGRRARARHAPAAGAGARGLRARGVAGRRRRVVYGAARRRARRSESGEQLLAAHRHVRPRLRPRPLNVKC